MELIKFLIIYFFVFLFMVFVYMVLGAFILKLFLIFLRITKNNPLIKFFINRVLIEDDIMHPKFELILWCTIFWPILLFLFIITFPTIAFTYTIQKMFKDETKNNEEK